jgi:hypothetical protein
MAVMSRGIMKAAWWEPFRSDSPGRAKERNHFHNEAGDASLVVGTRAGGFKWKRKRSPFVISMVARIGK